MEQSNASDTVRLKTNSSKPLCVIVIWHVIGRMGRSRESVIVPLLQRRLRLLTTLIAYAKCLERSKRSAFSYQPII